MQASHIDDQELECYFLGTVTESQLARIEEHLLRCDTCVARAKEIGRQINEMHAAEDEQD